MSVGGGIFAAKQNPGLQDNVTYKVFTREERLTIDHFSAPDRRISFVPSRGPRMRLPIFMNRRH